MFYRMCNPSGIDRSDDTGFYRKKSDLIMDMFRNWTIFSLLEGSAIINNGSTIVAHSVARVSNDIPSTYAPWSNLIHKH